MTEEEYWASEMRDSDLDAAAAGGEYFLEESGFSADPSGNATDGARGRDIVAASNGWLRSRRLQVAQGMLLDRKRLTSCIVIEDAEFESHSGLIKSPEDRRELEKHNPGLVTARDRAS